MQVSQFREHVNAQRRVEPHRWRPNAGTRLVVEVMNNFKRRYPFVDLLKPEATAAVPMDSRARIPCFGAG